MQLQKNQKKDLNGQEKSPESSSKRELTKHKSERTNVTPEKTREPKKDLNGQEKPTESSSKRELTKHKSERTSEKNRESKRDLNGQEKKIFRQRC